MDKNQDNRYELMWIVTAKSGDSRGQSSVELGYLEFSDLGADGRCLLIHENFINIL